MTIDYTTSGQLAESIRTWATRVAIPTIDIEQVVIEALDAAEFRGDGEGIHYELRGSETKSGRPEVFTA